MKMCWQGVSIGWPDFVLIYTIQKSKKQPSQHPPPHKAHCAKKNLHCFSTFQVFPTGLGKKIK
jgi:hypothetical protein